MTDTQTKHDDGFDPLREALARMTSLLNDPHTGLITWNVAINDAKQKIMRELNV